jgi:hypothetical protein
MLAFQLGITEHADSGSLASAVQYAANLSSAVSKEIEAIDSQTAQVLDEFPRVLDGDTVRVLPNGSIERSFLRDHRPDE